jgi:putative endopeptidase
MRIAAPFPALILSWLIVYPAIGHPLDSTLMDRAIKPSEDFYTFANGAWLKNTPIPNDHSEWSVSYEVMERNYQVLHQILEEAAAETKNGSASAGSPRALVGQFFASGMREQEINSEGAKPLQPQFGAIQRIADAKDLASELGRLHSFDIGILFRFTGGIDAKETTSQIGIATQSGLGLPNRDYYLKQNSASKKIRDQYVEHISKMLQLLGDPDAVSVHKAKQILRLETALATVSKSPVDLRVPEANYHKISFADLTQLAPQFNWRSYFDALGVPLTRVGTIDVEQPAFLKGVSRLIREVPIDTWKAYLRWHLIRTTAPFLSDPFVAENFRFYQRTLSGVAEIEPRWKRVLQRVDLEVGEALGQLYVEKNFPPEAKERALAMVSDLRGALRDKLQNLEWMESATRSAALKKLDAMSVKIGYPDKWRDYSGIGLKERPYVLNVLAGMAFEKKRQLAKIGTPVDRSEWGMTPPTVNAEYDPELNAIEFPAGILQPPFFDPKADDAANYGDIGATIGHEMTHGFDDEGRKYDAQGNMKNWWTSNDEKHFQERAKRIIDQFDHYVAIGNEHVNGRLTEGENIADLDGLRVAFAAFESALRRKPELERHAKMDGFSPEQRFFISYAQGWRTKTRPEELKLRLKTDVHSPEKFRANGPLSNMAEFAGAFEVPENCPMSRPAARRVTIW